MGMVVRTNVMAINAYRQLGMNNSQVGKSLEKLSSGFRINRAGDDASGLAISEKMKAQIKGLETASANAQDGISLIQTAEGALTEVHDMLNRMVELAGKSANGTMDDGVDRAALQDEMNSLLEEIDRIAQGTNFNGLKLLDGTLAASSKGVSMSAAINNRDILDVGTVEVAATKATYTVGFTGGTLPTGLTATSTADEIAKFFGVSTDDYTITNGAAGAMKIVAKVAGADANRDKILTKALGEVYETIKGADSYNDTTITVNGSDLKLIGNTMTVNGKNYKFVGDLDVAMDGTTAVANSGDMLEGGYYAIYIADAADSDAIADEIAKAVNAVEGSPATAWASTGLYTGALNTTGSATTAAEVDGTTTNKITFHSANFSTSGDAKSGGLTLQIGDTADSFNKITVAINDMSAKGLGIAGLDISNQDAASASLALIRGVAPGTGSTGFIGGAINMVSTQRAQLGALQNRLEHTINNLDVAAENITNANSRIRDTDMAKEMMEYTKMTVLTQAAQAMLAQATQQPQSILQLLQ